MSKVIYIPYDNNLTITKTPFISSITEIGDFAVQTNLNSTKVDKSPIVFQNVASYTLDDISSLSTTITSTATLPLNVNLNLNKTSVQSFAKYSSLEKNILLALDYIFLNFPAVLFVNNTISKKISENILNSYYNEITNKTSFVVNTNFIENSLQINYLNVALADEGLSKYRTLKDYYEKYFLEVNGIDYKITGFQGSSRFQNSFISFEVEGNPFDDGNNSIKCYIKPNSDIVTEFYLNAPPMVEFLLDGEKEDGFYSKFDDEIVSNNNFKLQYLLTIIFPKSDKYNPDLSSDKFETYKTDLIEYAKKQDGINTNILVRKYVESNLLLPVLDNLEAIENQNDKLEVLLATFAYSFDERFKFVNSLKNLRFLTYNKNDNISDDLLDLYIDNLGLEVHNKLSTDKKRELALNVPFLLKQKGTRASIDYIFNFLNIPLSLVEFNEKIKVAEKIDVELLTYYYNLVYGNTNISQLSVNASGEPKPNPNIIFEDSNYWQQYLLIDQGLNGKFFSTTKNITTEEIIYEYDFETTGTTFDYMLLSSSCYDSTVSVINDDLKTTLYDECGCEIENNDQTLEIVLNPIDLYTGCTNPIIDVWQECIGINEIKLHIDVYGGKSPYTFIGAQNGDIYLPNEYFSVYVEDNDGCESMLVTGTTYCYKASCFDNPIIVNLDYVCNLDENDVPIGTATVILNVSGGTEPYTFNGNQNGDILPDGELIVSEVVDSLGCTSGIITKLISCQSGSCEEIVLESTAECTSNIRPTDTLINVTYDLLNIPNTTTLNNVVMTITEVSGGDILGNPVTEIFNLESGVRGIVVDFGVSVGTITFNVDITITLANGCLYHDNYNLSVDCTAINIPTNYTNTLIPQ